MQTIALSNNNAVEIISAYAATNQQITAVTAEPGWFVVGAFKMPSSATGSLEIVGSVSDDSLVMSVRLFDVTDALPVEGSTVTTSATIDEDAISGEVELTGGHVYQMQAQVIGPSGFGTLKSATLT